MMGEWGCVEEGKKNPKKRKNSWKENLPPVKFLPDPK